MPTYEFRCPSGHEFERFYRTISAGVSELPCPECGAVATRQLSRSGLVFKGSGFYLTDYGKNAHRGQKADEKPDEKADKKSDTTADTKTDTKTDKKSDTKAESKAELKAAPADAGTRKPKPKPTSE